MSKYKRIALIGLMILVILTFTACGELQNSKITKYAQIILPDGTIIEGLYNNYESYTNGSIHIVIDGVGYWTHINRIVIWEEK